MGDGNLTRPEIEALVEGTYDEHQSAKATEQPVIIEPQAEKQDPIAGEQKSGPALDYWQVRELCKRHNLFANKCRSKSVAKKYICNLDHTTRENLEKEAKQHGVRYKKYALVEVQKILQQAIAEYENLAKLTDAVELPVAFRRPETVTAEPAKTIGGEVDLYHQRLFTGQQNGNVVKLSQRFENNLRALKLRSTAEVARTYMPMQNAQALQKGDFVHFEKLAGEAIDVYAEGQKMAEGEIVVMDNHCGVRITNVVSFVATSASGDSLSLAFDEPFTLARLVLGADLKTVSDLCEITEGSIIEFGRTVDSPWRLEIGSDELNPDIVCLGEMLVRNDTICFEILTVIGNNTALRRMTPLKPSARHSTAKKVTARKGQSAKGLKKGDVDAILKKIPQRHLVNFLRQESPQTCALVLSLMNSWASPEILKLLPPIPQPEIIRRIAQGVSVPAWVLAEIYAELQILAAADLPVDAGGGIKPAAEMIVMSGRATERFIIESLEDEDPETAEKIKQNLFVFEDLVLLEDRAIQKVLREAENQVLALSMRGVDLEVQEKIFRNMSQRAQKLLKEDMDFMGPVRLRDVQDAQQTIVNIVRQLEENGDIIIARAGDHEPMILD